MAETKEEVLLEPAAHLSHPRYAAGADLPNPHNRSCLTVPVFHTDGKSVIGVLQMVCGKADASLFAVKQICANISLSLRRSRALSSENVTRMHPLARQRQLSVRYASFSNFPAVATQ